MGRVRRGPLPPLALLRFLWSRPIGRRVVIAAIVGSILNIIAGFELPEVARVCLLFVVPFIVASLGALTAVGNARSSTERSRD